MRSIRTVIVGALLTLTVSTAAVAQQFGTPGLDEDGYAPLGALIGGETAVVVEVVDGDTIVVDRGNGAETVRYIGIDAPNLAGPFAPDEPLAPAAAKANEELVGDRTVILQTDISEADREGRLLRYVWLETDDGLLFVNNELVKHGLADVEANAPNTRNYTFLSRTQAAAMADKVGMWSPDAVPTATPAPTRGPIDTSIRTYDADFRYRWLAGSEYDCRQAHGCWGLVILPDTDCPGWVEVEIVIQDAQGDRLETVTKQRNAVERGREERFKIVPTYEGAYLAYIGAIGCLQSP